MTSSFKLHKYLGITSVLLKYEHLRCLHRSSNVEYITICEGETPPQRHSISILWIPELDTPPVMAMVISLVARLRIPPSGISITTDPARSRPN